MSDALAIDLNSAGELLRVRFFSDVLDETAKAIGAIQRSLWTAQYLELIENRRVQVGREALPCVARRAHRDVIDGDRNRGICPTASRNAADREVGLHRSEIVQTGDTSGDVAQRN